MGGAPLASCTHSACIFRDILARVRVLAYYVGTMANGLTYARKTNSVEETQQLAQTLAKYLHPADVVVLTGDLGAGKTHFVQGVAQGLGITAPVTSPTFNVLLEYDEGRIPLYHFDLYRLEDADQLEDVGYFDVIESDGVSFIEWGEKFPRALPYGYLEIRIQVLPEGSRRVIAHALGSRARQLLCVWASDAKARLTKTELSSNDRVTPEAFKQVDAQLAEARSRGAQAAGLDPAVPTSRLVSVPFESVATMPLVADGAAGGAAGGAGVNAASR